MPTHLSWIAGQVPALRTPSTSSSPVVGPSQSRLSVFSLPPVSPISPLSFAALSRRTSSRADATWSPIREDETVTGTGTLTTGSRQLGIRRGPSATASEGGRSTTSHVRRRSREVGGGMDLGEVGRAQPGHGAQAEPLPVKRGELGWRESVHGKTLDAAAAVAVVGASRGTAGAGAARSPATSPSPTPASTSRTLVSTNFAAFDPIVWASKCPPGTSESVGLVVALALLVTSIVVGVVVLPASLASSNASSASSNSTSNSTSPSPPDNNSTTTSQSLSSSGGLPSSSFAYLLMLLLAFTSLFVLYGRIRAFYAFHRRRFLLRSLAGPGDDEARPSPSSLEASPAPAPAYSIAPAPGSTSTSSSASVLRPYTPHGPLALFEFLLALPPSTLIPSPNPTSSLSSHLRSLRAGRSPNPNEEPSPEDRAVDRAQREGAAPWYGGEEMRASTVVLVGPKRRGRGGEPVNRFSWRSWMGGAGAGEQAAQEEEPEQIPAVGEMQMTTGAQPSTLASTPTHIPLPPSRSASLSSVRTARSTRASAASAAGVIAPEDVVARDEPSPRTRVGAAFVPSLERIVSREREGPGEMRERER